MAFKTADIADDHRDKLRVPFNLFLHFGLKPAFEGVITTVKVFEDNVLVKKTLEENGEGRVLVVDGGGSERVALLGDNVAALAEKNEWEGILIYGCIRDSADIDQMHVAIRALGTHPFKSIKKGEGDVNIPVTFAGITFNPGEYMYADEDGILVTAKALL